MALRVEDRKGKAGFPEESLWPALVSSLSPMSPQVWKGDGAGSGSGIPLSGDIPNPPGHVPVSCGGDCTPPKTPGDKKGVKTTWIVCCLCVEGRSGQSLCPLPSLLGHKDLVGKRLGFGVFWIVRSV